MSPVKCLRSPSAGDGPRPVAAKRVEHTLTVGQYRLHYEVYGSGDRVLVWLNPILFDSKLSRGLAQALAARGNRVVLLDLLGHGQSDKPVQPSAHRMDLYARHVLALLDELGVDQVVLGGISLGTNVSLLTAAQAPERVRGTHGSDRRTAKRHHRARSHSRARDRPHPLVRRREEPRAPASRREAHPHPHIRRTVGTPRPADRGNSRVPRQRVGRSPTAAPRELAGTTSACRRGRVLPGR
jgi:pimeloyl-ACP methyl ester carboxylesterase